MIRDRDYQPCERQLGRLTPSRDRIWLDLSNTQAKIPTVTLPHNGVAVAFKSKISPMPAQKTLTKYQSYLTVQPDTDSLFGRTLEQR